MGGMDGGDSDFRPKYKMVRFFDWNARPGVTYRYRVRLLIEDPNRPNTTANEIGIPVQTPPAVTSLSPAVLTRLKAQPNSFYRETEFSKPTPPIRVDVASKIFASKVTPPKMRAAGKTGSYAEGEPVGVLKPVVTDYRRGVEITLDRQVSRGDVLDFIATGEYAHPITWTIMSAKDFSFQTNAMVADMRGGDPLPFRKDDNFSAPGEFAMVDANGEIIVRHQLDDDIQFRKYTFVDDDPQASAELTKAANEGTMGDGEMAGQMQGSMGGDIFGGKGKRKKKKKN